MPFDGGFLHKIKQELEPMIGARVDKIGQPNRDCVVIHLHNRGPVRRLVILAGAAPRLHFSAIPIEYPATPPMFCLLLRKHLGGGRLTAVTQQGLDRVLTLHFEATNELGDRAKFRLVCELMGRQGNLVLVGENGKVIDEAKNDKAGAISFKALEFDKAGTYKYTISEVNDKQKEIKYDTSEKAVTITVKDSGDGYLQAQVESEKQLIFTNTFEAAGGSGTKTGDNMNLVLPIMMMLTAAAIGSVLLIRRKYHR